MNRLEARLQELEALFVQAGRGSSADPPNLAAILSPEVADLQDALLQESSRAEAAEILRQLVDEIALTPENGELRIDLRGELAGILRLTSGNKEPVTVDRDGLQVTLVAGRGFEPLTFRL